MRTAGPLFLGANAEVAENVLGVPPALLPRFAAAQEEALALEAKLSALPASEITARLGKLKCA